MLDKIVLFMLVSLAFMFWLMLIIVIGKIIGGMI